MTTAVEERPQRLERRERCFLLWLFVGAAAVSLLFQEGAVTVYDGRTVYAVTQSVIERGTFAVDEELVTLAGRGSHHYSRFGVGLSLVAAVPYVLVRPLAVRTDFAEKILEAVASSVMAFVTAALLVAVYFLGRRLNARPLDALLVGVGAVAGTFVLPYSKEFFSEPLTALCLVVAMERLLARSPLVSGWAMGAAVLVRPQSLLLAPVLGIVALWKGGIPSAVRLGAGVLPGMAAAVAYNIVRFGDPLEFGYAGFGFTNPVTVGVHGLLFEPTKSVLLFAPVVMVLPAALVFLWRSSRPAFVLLVANLGITLAVTVTWFAWHGGWSWGPRLLIPGLVPALAALAPWMTSTLRRGAVVGLLAAGLVVSFPALIVSTQTQQMEVAPIPPGTPYLPTAPLASPSPVRQMQLIGPVAQYSVEHLYEREDDGLNYMRYLSLWQLGLTRIGGRAGLAVSVAGSLVLLGAAGVSVHAARSHFRALEPGVGSQPGSAPGA